MQSKSRLLVGLGVLAALAPMAMAQGGIKAFGPPSEFGFPSYYQDHQDLRLSLCADQTDPLCGIPPEEFLIGPPVITDNPAEGNFYHESFYWSAGSIIAVPNRGDAELVMAVEAVFGNELEAVIDGDQTVFSRLRIRLRGDGFTGGFYRIFTPYGVFVFDAPGVEPGRRIVNFTADCLHVPQIVCGSAPLGPNANYFTTPLGILDDGTPAPEVAPNGPHFLVWDPSVLPLAPAGYVGDPAIPHPVVGATAPNQNVFRIQYSPSSSFSPIVFDVQTNLFSVMGKIAAGDPCEGAVPVASFVAAPTSGIAPVNVQFTDTSSCATSWSWDFGDGATSTQQSPSHNYTQPGVYTVSLTASGPGGSDNETKVDHITVAAPPVNTLTLASPVPGNAGVNNTFVVSGARPGATVGVYSSLVNGTSILNLGNCGGIPISLGRPFRLLGRARANAAGVATIVSPAPGSAAGRLFRFQAVEPASCRVSSVVTDVF